MTHVDGGATAESDKVRRPRTTSAGVKAEIVRKDAYRGVIISAVLLCHQPRWHRHQNGQDNQTQNTFHDASSSLTSGSIPTYTSLTHSCSGQQVLSWMPRLWRWLGLWRQC